jgi:receptor-type tyrosine-protein phosphatase F
LVSDELVISEWMSQGTLFLCSAGVGRTGVFISLSIVLERMQYEGVVDVFQTVRGLRTQRPAMVQTEDQYQFCYRAALEYLSSFDTPYPE